MSMLVWQAARAKAQQITKSVPVAGDNGLDTLRFIAEQYGAIVRVHPLRAEVSGVIHKPDPNSSPVITINETEPITRQRFTLAHEIGHLIERTEIAEDRDYSFIDYRSSTDYDLHEFFADEFAGELLMPEPEFSNWYKQHGEFATSLRYAVSLPAVRKRMERLQKNPAEVA